MSGKTKLIVYLLLAAILVVLALPPAAIAAGTVILRLVPSATNLSAGSSFTVKIQVEAGTATVAGADAFINFDPVYLEATAITPDTGKFPTILNNHIDNIAGHADYSSGKTIQPFASGTFTIATITFRCKAPANDIAVDFNTTVPRNSDAAKSGNSILGGLVGFTVTQYYDIPLRLLPSSNTGIAVGEDFALSLQVSIPEGVTITGVDAFLNFDPALLEVRSITPDRRKLGNVVLTPPNIGYDNNAGTIGYSALKSAIQPEATGTFTIATITFRGKAAAVTSTVSFNMTVGRMSVVAHAGEVVYGTHANATIEISDAAKIIGTVTLQGSNRPPDGLNVPLTVRLFSSDTTLNSANILTEPAAYCFSTAAQTVSITQTSPLTSGITFTTAPTIIPGIYHISLTSEHCLVNLKRNVTVTGDTTVDMGILLEGNADNNNQIFGADLNMLLCDFLQQPGDAKWNGGRCDFDGDGQVTAVDFSALAINYTLTSPIELP